MYNNSNLDLVNINAYAKPGWIPSFCSQDIERKRNWKYPRAITVLYSCDKLTLNNPNLDLVNIYSSAKFGCIPSITSQEILTITKGHTSAVNMRKLTRNNYNLDLVTVNAYAKFDQISSIC